MTNSTETADALGLTILTEERCKELLTSQAFGRLAMNLPDGPTILPVNYLFIDPTIVIRTAAGSKLDCAPMTVVAFEIDYISADHSWGWSVVARGYALDISTAIDDYSEQIRELPFRPWLSGVKDHVIKINARVLSGRSFGDAQAAGRITE